MPIPKYAREAILKNIDKANFSEIELNFIKTNQRILKELFDIVFMPSDALEDVQRKVTAFAEREIDNAGLDVSEESLKNIKNNCVNISTGYNSFNRLGLFSKGHLQKLNFLRKNNEGGFVTNIESNYIPEFFGVGCHRKEFYAHSEEVFYLVKESVKVKGYSYRRTIVHYLFNLDNLVKVAVESKPRLIEIQKEVDQYLFEFNAHEEAKKKVLEEFESAILACKSIKHFIKEYPNLKCYVPSKLLPCTAVALLVEEDTLLAKLEVAKKPRQRKISRAKQRKMEQKANEGKASN